MRKLFFLSVILLSIASSVNAETAAQPIQEFLKLSSTNQKVEFFWQKPEGPGPFPVLLLIHPHQEWPSKIGAKVFVDSGTMKSWTEKGWMTVAYSQPGYGASDGPADFCGPATQQAVLEVINHVRAMENVKKDSIVVYGGSRGAVIAAFAAAKDPQLAGAILKAGLYDFSDAYKNYPWYSLIKLTMAWELGGVTDEKLTERSALQVADKIKIPLLMFHGTGDDRAPIQYAEAFAKKVRARGVPVDLISFDSEHIIPPEKIQADMSAFLEKVKK